MKTNMFFVLAALSLAFVACIGQVPSSGVTPQGAVTPPPTNASSQLSIGDLPSTAKFDGKRVVFTESGFSIELSADKWQFEPTLYQKASDFEGFVFTRRTPFVDSTGTEFTPTIGIMFYSISSGMQLTDFSAALRAQLGNGFPSIESMFGYEGSEPKLNIPAIGYYGHLPQGNHHSIYIIHTVKDTAGIQASFEIADSVLDQAKPEFFEIMQSLEFTQ